MAVTERVTEVWTGSSTKRKVDLKAEENKGRRSRSRRRRGPSQAKSRQKADNSRYRRE